MEYTLWRETLLAVFDLITFLPPKLEKKTDYRSLVVADRCRQRFLACTKCVTQLDDFDQIHFQYLDVEEVASSLWNNSSFRGGDVYCDFVICCLCCLPSLVYVYRDKGFSRFAPSDLR